jgi:hypothetical protein
MWCNVSASSGSVTPLSVFSSAAAVPGVPGAVPPVCCGHTDTAYLKRLLAFRVLLYCCS